VVEKHDKQSHPSNVWVITGCSRRPQGEERLQRVILLIVSLLRLAASHPSRLLDSPGSPPTPLPSAFMFRGSLFFRPRNVWRACHFRFPGINILSRFSHRLDAFVHVYHSFDYIPTRRILGPEKQPHAVLSGDSMLGHVPPTNVKTSSG